MSPRARFGVGVGALVERLQLLQNQPPSFAVSVVRVGTIATVTTPSAHGYTTGDFVAVAGATPSGYNGHVKVTVTSPTTFTYTVASTLATPPSGTVTATYLSDASGGRALGWVPVGLPLHAELVPLRGAEVQSHAATQSEVDYRFRVRRRHDLTTSYRVAWRPTWPPGAPTQTLSVVGVLPLDDGREDPREFMWLDTKGA